MDAKQVGRPQANSIATAQGLVEEGTLDHLHCLCPDSPGGRTQETLEVLRNRGIQPGGSPNNLLAMNIIPQGREI